MNSLFNFECYFFTFIADSLHKISNPVSFLSSQGTEVNKNSTSYTSVVSLQKKKKKKKKKKRRRRRRRKRKKRKIKKESGARLQISVQESILV